MGRKVNEGEATAYRVGKVEEGGEERRGSMSVGGGYIKTLCCVYKAQLMFISILLQNITSDSVQGWSNFGLALGKVFSFKKSQGRTFICRSLPYASPTIAKNKHFKLNFVDFFYFSKNGHNRFLSVQEKNNFFCFSSTFALKQAKEQISFQVQPKNIYQ